MNTQLLLIHGRGQQTSLVDRNNPVAERAHVSAMKQRWIDGLNAGSASIGISPLTEDPGHRIYLPFYGNALADVIDAQIAAGQQPNLEMATGNVRARAVRDELILELADSMQFDPVRHLPQVSAEVRNHSVRAWQARQSGEEFSWNSLLKVAVVRSALGFLARKTGAAELIIENTLTDVAFYLDSPVVRQVVQKIIARDLDTAARNGPVIVVAHSLGTIVAYDALAQQRPDLDVPLMVTAGSPLGLPIVQRHLLGRNRPGEPSVPDDDAGKPLPWLNVYDTNDVVAIVNPLNGLFIGGTIRDERTLNPSDPHAIQEYLADPDVARPIRRALGGSSPW